MIWGFNNLFRGFAVVCGSGKGDETPQFHEFIPETLVNLGWPDNMHSSTNPKRVLMSSKHEICPFHMFWCVLPLPCHLPYQCYRIWDFTLQTHNVVAYLLHITCVHGRWLLWGSINTLNHVSMWFGALTICSEGLRWFAGPARVIKPRNFTNLYPKNR